MLNIRLNDEFMFDTMICVVAEEEVVSKNVSINVSLLHFYKYVLDIQFQRFFCHGRKVQATG